MNLAARLAWLLALAPPVPPGDEDEGEEQPSVPCPALGPVTVARCGETQDRGRVRACDGCRVGVLPPGLTPGAANGPG